MCSHKLPIDFIHTYLFRALIGSSCCLHLLQLTRVISLVLVFRHSIENRSGAEWDASPSQDYHPHSPDLFFTWVERNLRKVFCLRTQQKTASRDRVTCQPFYRMYQLSCYSIMYGTKPRFNDPRYNDHNLAAQT